MNWLLEAGSAGIAAAESNVKMVIAVREDLGMGAGKVAAQCAHAAVDLYRTLSRQNGPASAVLEQWELNGETKIVVGCKNADALVKLATTAEAVQDVTCSIIRDAGRTEVAAGSMTVAVRASVPFYVCSSDVRA